MPFIPLWDRNPKKHVQRAYVTIGLNLLFCIIYLWQTTLSEIDLINVMTGLGMTPAIVMGTVPIASGAPTLGPELSLLSYAFLHGDILHLTGNMLYLAIFGDNVEDAMGHTRFLIFFMLSVVLAALAQVAATPDAITPVIGASGATSAMLGAYVVLHPRVEVLILVMKRIPMRVPAYVALFGWLALQLLESLLNPSNMSVAWWAHIGGFVAGAILIIPFRRRGIILLNMSKRLPAPRASGTTGRKQ